MGRQRNFWRDSLLRIFVHRVASKWGKSFHFCDNFDLPPSQEFTKAMKSAESQLSSFQPKL